MARIVGWRALQASIMLALLLLNMSDAPEHRLGDGLLAKAFGLVLFVVSGVVAGLAFRTIERVIVNRPGEKKV
jgi:hypothetical protein